MQWFLQLVEKIIMNFLLIVLHHAKQVTTGLGIELLDTTESMEYA